jgi:VWFA-related protein
MFVTANSAFRPGAAFGLTLVALVMAGPPVVADDQAGLVIRSTTRLVQMSVIALDKQGRPVLDLKKEDFEVFDNGRPCSLTVFVVETPDSAVRPQPLPHNTFTNQFARTTGARSGYAVIVLDWLNTLWSDQTRARQQVVQMLKRIEQHDRIALYVLDRRLKVINEFSDDAATLLEKLANLRGGPSDLLDVQRGPINDASVSAPSASSSMGPTGTGLSHPSNDFPDHEQAFQLDQRIQETLQAFQIIADHLTTVPGRKILIWVSAGFPLNIDSSGADSATRSQGDYAAQISRTIQKLNNANVAVYPVDARGLIVSSSAYHTIWTMKEFAARTGGLAWYNRNDLDAGVRNALDDIRFSYTIGFSPPEEAKYGSHKLRVKVRRAGVTLRYRDGYYLDEPGNSQVQDQRAEVARAMLSPVDSTAIPITVRAARNQDHLMSQMSLDAGSLDLALESGGWQGKLEFQACFQAPDGRRVGSVTTQVVEINMRPQTHDAALRNGLTFRVALPIPPDATALKLLVWDVRSGKIGTLSIPLKTIMQN